jgi:hypothetical protein
MKRKRAPGGGRKPRAGPTSSLTFRIPDDLRRDLEQEATEGATVSERLLWHLRRSMNRKREEERDPAMQGLLLVIARLAEDVTGGDLMPEKGVRSYIRSQWRTDLFQFRTFKFAVKKLLDTLEEPPESLTQEEREQLAKEAAETFGGDSPEFDKLFVELQKSPEAMGAWVFGNLWKRFTHSHLPFTERERRMMSWDPVLGRAMEREGYDFQKAQKALELKPEKEDLSEAVKRIMKDRNLDPENEPPPDIQEAVKLIVDRVRRRVETAEGLPPGEALKLFQSDPLPTLDEALKLIKIRKPKGQSR